MKFVKSLSLPVLSLALLVPMAPAHAFDVKAAAQAARTTATQIAGDAANYAKNAWQNTGITADTLSQSFKNTLAQADKSANMILASAKTQCSVVAQKLGLEDNRGFKGTLNDAKDAFSAYNAAHPRIVLAAAAGLVFGTGFLLARSLYKKKNA